MDGVLLLAVDCSGRYPHAQVCQNHQPAEGGGDLGRTVGAANVAEVSCHHKRVEQDAGSADTRVHDGGPDTRVDGPEVPVLKRAIGFGNIAKDCFG